MVLRRRSHRCPLHTSSPSLRPKHQSGPPADDTEKPVRYSRTEAREWKAYDTFLNEEEKTIPKYQFWIMTASWVVFLVYFVALREENDIDDFLSVSLYEHVPGLEEQQLEIAIQVKEELGEDTTTLVAKLKDVQRANNGTSSE